LAQLKTDSLLRRHIFLSSSTDNQFSFTSPSVPDLLSSASTAMDSILYPVAALAGIATHLGYFIRGEHHMAGPKLIPFYLSLYALLCLILHQFGGISIHQSITMASVAAASYLTALFASMLVYRAFFHPLRGFKGPFASRLSNLYHVSHLGKLDNYKFVDRLHKQYGDIVRTGTCPLPSLYRPLLNPI
jgi:hypothetical protein